MGKKSNVNPDHYKTAGRERQGEDIDQAVHKQKLTRRPGGPGSGRRQSFPGPAAGASGRRGRAEVGGRSGPERSRTARRKAAGRRKASGAARARGRG